MPDKATTRRSAHLTVHPCFGLFWLDRLSEGAKSDWRYVIQQPGAYDVHVDTEVPHIRPAAQNQL